jgi:hypothetical protein
MPAELGWIEVDFAEMLDYKDERMAGATPRLLAGEDGGGCQRRSATPSDLRGGGGRTGADDHRGAADLPGGTVEALAAQPVRDSGIAYWLSDVVMSGFGKAIRLDTAQAVQHVQTPDCLEGEQILSIVQRNGRVRDTRRRYIIDMRFATERVRRLLGDRAQHGPPPGCCMIRAGTALEALIVCGSRTTTEVRVLRHPRKPPKHIHSGSGV